MLARVQYEVKFYGCRHVLLEEYDIIRTELSKREYLSSGAYSEIRFGEVGFIPDPSEYIIFKNKNFLVNFPFFSHSFLVHPDPPEYASAFIL